MFNDQLILPFQKKVLSWYAKNKRDLPWRKTKDPYNILVSEVMLQQTQVDRVTSFYLRWLEHFPSLKELACASKADVLRLWSGLGYNNRALRLQQLAHIILDKHAGVFPVSEDALLALPGIGPYTARAVLAFAYNKEVPVIDTNIRRVLIHELQLPQTLTQKELEYIAMRCVPLKKSRLWHNALMDYGAIEKTARITGIKPQSKQSAFAGSDRQLRGYVLKSLLSKKHLLVAELSQGYGTEKTKKVLAKMQHEKIIQSDGSLIWMDSL